MKFSEGNSSCSFSIVAATWIFQRANNILGETMIDAYAAARKIIEAFMQPLGTIATANSTFVSQNWSARKYERMKATLWKVMMLETAWGAIACGVVYLIEEKR